MRGGQCNQAEERRKGGLSESTLAGVAAAHQAGLSRGWDRCREQLRAMLACCSTSGLPQRQASLPADPAPAW